MYDRSVLANGLRVVTSTLPGTYSVSISVFVGAGSRYETDELAGVSHFLEHMLFKGTPRRPTPRQVSEEIEGIGGIMNAATDKELTVYWCKVGRQHFARAFDVMIDNIRNSLFEPSEIEKERQVIFEELAMTEDSPGDLVGLLIDETIWPDQPLGRDIGGSRASVAQLDRDMMRGYLARQYVPENIVLAVAGNISHAHAVAAATELLGDWKSSDYDRWPPVVDEQAGPRVRLRSKRTEQAHLSIGLPAYPAEHPDRFALDVLNALLGEGMSSRLFLEIRERLALAYDVSSYVSRYRDAGALVIGASVEPARAVETVKVVLNELAGLHQPIEESELNKARELLKGRLQLRLEDTGAVASWLGRQELLRRQITTAHDALASLDAVSNDDLLRVSHELIRPDRVNLAVVGPYRGPGRFEAAVR